MRRTVLALVIAVAVLTGCNEASVPAKLSPGQQVALKGKLIAGVECPMIEIQGGRRFAVAGDLGAFKLGDRVCLRGEVAAMSTCMAGEATIAVTAIEAEKACP